MKSRNTCPKNILVKLNWQGILLNYHTIYFLMFNDRIRIYWKRCLIISHFYEKAIINHEVIHYRKLPSHIHSIFKKNIFLLLMNEKFQGFLLLFVFKYVLSSGFKKFTYFVKMKVIWKFLSAKFLIFALHLFVQNKQNLKFSALLCLLNKIKYSVAISVGRNLTVIFQISLKLYAVVELRLFVSAFCTVSCSI